MELALLRTLMDKQFYDDHRGSKCPDRLFGKDNRKIKYALDLAIENYQRSVTPDEIEALFISSNPSMTSAQKNSYQEIFNRIKRENALGKDVAQEVLAKLFQQVVGEEIANLGFDYVNGAKSTLEPLRELLDRYTDDFMPNLHVDWDDISIDTLLSQNDLETRWKFNIPVLCEKVEGVNAGHLIEVGARSNIGKTSFHASMIASPKGFASQGANCMVLCNEERSPRVGARYLQACTGMTLLEIKEDPKTARDRYDKIRDNIFLKDVTNKDMAWVESVCKSYKPDVVVLDMGDKLARMQGFTRVDEALKANVVYARQIAKMYDCAIFYMSQLSAEAEGRVDLNQAMMEGSRTGKAAEADLMILIAKNPPVPAEKEESPVRYLNIVKNKLSGWHGRLVCELDYKTARYTV